MSLNEIKVGMRVRRRDLENIWGAWVYFDSYDHSRGGRIICITSDEYSDAAVEAVSNNGGNVSFFYQRPVHSNLVIIE